MRFDLGGAPSAMKLIDEDGNNVSEQMIPQHTACFEQEVEDLVRKTFLNLFTAGYSSSTHVQPLAHAPSSPNVAQRPVSSP